MQGYFMASSFQPPVVTRASARYAPWVLLDKKAYFAVRENATTAEAVTSTGNAFKVTFCLADLPAISHFCVHGPEFQRDDLRTEPLVVFSAKDLVLLRFILGRSGPRSRLEEYFVYKADHGKPSLTLIPRTPPGTINLSKLCVLPFDGEDGGFVVAGLCKTVLSPSDYEIHVFSSRTGKWATTPLRLQTYHGLRKEDLPGHLLDKVIALGGCAVGWIDLWRGILTCNVFDKNPVLSFIPIPMLAYCNEQRISCPWLIRGVTCSNGYIGFVELELITQMNSKTREDNLDSVDIIHDSEMFFHNENARANKKKCLIDACVGWKLRTCTRHTTWNYWRKGPPIDIDGFLAQNPDRYMWLPQLWNAAAGRSTPKNQCSVCPSTLDMDSEDVVYMMSKLSHDDKNAWMVGVNLGKKMTDVRVRVSGARARYFNLELLIFEFSEYLNAGPSSRSSTGEVKSAPNAEHNCHLSSDCF